MQNIGLSNANQVYLNNQLKNNMNYNANNSVALNSTNLDDDSFELSKKENTPINFKEGAHIFFNGFKNKLKNLVSAIAKHPIRTIAMVAATTALLSALPLIGISTVAAGSALTLLYAGIAVGKTGYHTIQFVKDNKNQEYDKARSDLEKMGGDSLDLALTLPFVPKAVNNVREFARYGQIGVNKELIADMKNTKGVGNKIRTLKTGNTKISENIEFNKTAEKFCTTADELREFKAMESLPTEEFVQKTYKKMVEKMEIQDIAPEFKLSREMNDNFIGGYNFNECSIEFNLNRFENMDKAEILDAMRHELEHYKQNAEIARYKGIDSFVEMQAQCYTNKVESLSEQFSGLSNEQLKFAANTKEKAESIEKIIQFREQGKETFLQDTITNFKQGNGFNINGYQNTVDKLGIIQEGTQEAQQASKYVQATLDYPATIGKQNFIVWEVNPEYENNLLEVEARTAGSAAKDAYVVQKEIVNNIPDVNDSYISNIMGSTIRGESEICDL